MIWKYKITPKNSLAILLFAKCVNMMENVQEKTVYKIMCIYNGKCTRKNAIYVKKT